ncbi:hypothetical protein [Burkholderia cepacia]|uniref:hypothetical protein n=1 Tax=Burkholderia cepacia TaxID=292 RepID=UPI000B1C10AC|nr:hypothetical protein [Burkholderia cepacia]
MASPNVLELPVAKMAARRNPPAMQEALQERQAVVMRFDKAPNDHAILKHAAPWLAQEVDVIEEWRRCLFMSRLSRQLAASLTPTVVENMRWKTYRTYIRASISTPAVKVRIKSWSTGAQFVGHKDALVSAGIAHPDWLYTGPRSGRPTRFEIVTFGAARSVNVHLLKGRHVVTCWFTDEERACSPEEVCQQHAEAKERLANALKSLPASPSDFRQWFSDISIFIVDGLERLAWESKGGYSLDDRSRGNFLTTLSELRQATHRATSTFNYEERRVAIDRIAKEHAPAAPPILSP